MCHWLHMPFLIGMMWDLRINVLNFISFNLGLINWLILVIYNNKWILLGSRYNSSPLLLDYAGDVTSLIPRVGWQSDCVRTILCDERIISDLRHNSKKLVIRPLFSTFLGSFIDTEPNLLKCIEPAHQTWSVFISSSLHSLQKRSHIICLLWSV